MDQIAPKTSAPKREPICLIIPPSVFLLDERVFVNLGILKVAASLESRGYQVEILDLSGIANFEEVARIHADQTTARIFGLTTTTPQFPSAVRVAETIRSVRPDCRLIVGGPHPTLVHAAWRHRKSSESRVRAQRSLDQLLHYFDVVVAGDGEEAIFPALNCESRIIDADNVKSPLFLTNSTLDLQPFPARHLVDLKSYRFSIEGVPATSLIAQLGCPFACGFCSGRTSPMLRKIRLRSTTAVIDELRHLHQQYGYSGFMFYDDELNVNPRMLELMDAIRRLQDELGVQFKLRGCIKAQLFTAAQARAMKEAGFSTILVGFESGSERILTNINKKATRDENTRCVELCRQNELRVKALMSIGHPGESEESIEATRDWLLAAPPDEFNLSIITCAPGTFYYDHAIESVQHPGIWTYTYPPTGDRLHSLDVDYSEVMDYYNGDPEAGYRSFVFTDFLRPEDLVRLRDDVDMDVRRRLQIPFYRTTAAVRYDQSMGQTGVLPRLILNSADFGLRLNKSDA